MGILLKLSPTTETEGTLPSHDIFPRALLSIFSNSLLALKTLTPQSFPEVSCLGSPSVFSHVLYSRLFPILSILIFKCICLVFCTVSFPMVVTKYLALKGGGEDI